MSKESRITKLRPNIAYLVILVSLAAIALSFTWEGIGAYMEGAARNAGMGVATFLLVASNTLSKEVTKGLGTPIAINVCLLVTLSVVCFGSVLYNVGFGDSTVEAKDLANMAITTWLSGVFAVVMNFVLADHSQDD